MDNRVIQRQYLRFALEDELKRHSLTPATTVENDQITNTYELARALGYSDGLKQALHMLDQLPDEEPPSKEGRYILGDPRTEKYRRKKGAWV